MKRWALLTIILYGLCVAVLGIPVYLYLSEDTDGVIQFFYGYFLPVLVLIQIILLLVPVAMSEKRPVGRRSIVASSLFGAIPIAFLAMMFVISIALMIWGDAMIFDAGPGLNVIDKYIYNWPILIVPAIFWILWGFIFYRNYSAADPNKFTSVVTRWLLKGSILELLVAIPSHIISRHRQECCAPPITFIGIITGLAIALLSFGPGIFFLFAKRIKDKKRGS